MSCKTCGGTGSIMRNYGYCVESEPCAACAARAATDAQRKNFRDANAPYYKPRTPAPGGPCSKCGALMTDEFLAAVQAAALDAAASGGGYLKVTIAPGGPVKWERIDPSRVTIERRA